MNWKSLLVSQGYLVSDGAWGTQLAARGLGPGQCAEEWNAEHPDLVEAVARAYVEAGSNVILTNTFGGTSIKLARAGLAERADELNRAGAAISRRACGERALAWASIGPTGELLAPHGPLDPAEARDAFARQIAACVEGGAQGFVIETMMDLAEARAALQAARRAAPGLPAVVSMTYSRGPRGYATMMGVTPAQAAVELTAAGADAVGANCGAGIDEMIDVAAAMRAATALPLWLKPNAGLPQLVEDRTVYREGPADMAAKTPLLLDAGADIIGGCCGTSPEHIRAMAAAARAARGG
jgi:5-methyltetrahydrofolate--homocysteine methyltransferase